MSSAQNVSNRLYLLAPPWFVLVNGIYHTIIITWERT